MSPELLEITFLMDKTRILSFRLGIELDFSHIRAGIIIETINLV